VLIFAVLILFILLMIYAIIPYMLSTWAGVGAFKKGKRENEIAFTFDDGPDPIYTPELLDLLKAHRVKATFFVVGERAERYPALIKRMHEEGHLIGVHNYIHHCNWLMYPWTIKKGLDRSANIIEGIIGEKPKFYRPPWGMMNIFDFVIHPRFHTILWSLMVGDWKSKGGAEKRVRGILNNVKSGDIILLHDCGETWGADEDAPHYTIEGLKIVLQEVHSRGYHCVRIDEMMNHHF